MNQLLAQVDPAGRRTFTLSSLGSACGGLTHETIRLARSPDGVGPTVRDGILGLTGLTLEQLMQKHGIPAPVTLHRAPTPGFASATPSYSAQGMTPMGGFPVPDRVLLAKNVIEALARDGFTRDVAQATVSDILFNGQREWVDVLDLYQQARQNLEARSKLPPSAASGERAVADRLAGRIKQDKRKRK